MVTSKMFRLWMVISILFVLSGCAVNIVNLEPPKKPDTEIATIESAISRAEAAGQQDVLAVALQMKRVLLAWREIQEFSQWSYNERKSGNNASEEMKARLEKAIVDNWKLGEEVTKLYLLSAASKTELASDGKLFAKGVFEAVELSDEINQLSLGYTIAGLEWNAAFLKAEKEAYLNGLLKKLEELGRQDPTFGKGFVGRIALQAGNGGKSKCCDIPAINENHTKNPIDVIFEGDGGNDGEKGMILKEAIRKAAAKISLPERRGVTITIKADKMERRGLGGAVMNALVLLTFGYPGGGEDAVFRAFVAEEGGKPIPLVVDTYEINAKDFGALTSLVANRVVGQAHLALLREDMR